MSKRDLRKNVDRFGIYEPKMIDHGQGMLLISFATYKAMKNCLLAADQIFYQAISQFEARLDFLYSMLSGSVVHACPQKYREATSFSHQKVHSLLPGGSRWQSALLEFQCWAS